MTRCGWCCDGGRMQEYHDNEWGIPLHDDTKHFEYLLMEAMQCGLSWSLMLKKRSIFRQCFAEFDMDAVAAFDEADVTRILSTEGMIRSAPKIRAIIGNAAAFQRIIAEWGSFDRYIWSFSDGKTMVYRSHQRGQYETRNELSDRLAKDMKKRGFKYLGSVTLYSHLQACGIINDHEPECFLYHKILELGDIRYCD